MNDTVTERSKECREAAAKVAAVVAELPAVRAVTIGGSVARGDADACSDVDLFAFFDELPSEASNRELVASLGGKWWTREIRMNGSAVRATFGLGDARIDLEHVLIPHVESELDRVLVRHEWLHQQFVGGFYDCLPLSGHDLANVWIDRVRGYPDGLQTAMIEQHLTIEPLWLSEVYHKWRDDFFWIQRAYIRTIERVLGTLLGLNRLYKPSDGYKRLVALTERMKIAPENLGTRLKEVFDLPTLDAIASLSRVVEETFDLVEAHCPHINVEAARTEFRTDADMGD